MTLPFLRQLLVDRYGCDVEDVLMATTLDELNLSADDLAEIVMCLYEAFGVDIPEAEWSQFETVEDLLGYIEDRL